MQNLRQASTSFPQAGPGLGRPILSGRLLAGALWVLAQALQPVPAWGQEAKAKSIQELKGFFEQNCVRCHGRDGSARNADGKKLGGLDFTLATKQFQALSGPASEREIRAMIRTIRKGILFGYTMPAWKDQLSQEDADLMVREVLLKAEAGRAITPLTSPLQSR